MAITWNSPASGSVQTAYLNGYGYMSISGKTDVSYNQFRVHIELQGTTQLYVLLGTEHSAEWNSSIISNKSDFSISVPLWGRQLVSSPYGTGIKIIIQGAANDWSTWEDVATRNVYCKCIQKSNPSIIYLPEGASGLKYTGANLQVFSRNGSASGGTFRYGLGSSTTSAPSTWQSNYTAVTVINAGEYFLWYKVVGNTGYNDLGPYYLSTVTVEASIPFLVNIAGMYKQVISASVNVNGTWKDVTDTKTNVGGTWK